MLTNSITELSAIPSMSALLGSKGDAQLLQSINKLTGTSYFGSDHDRYAPQYRTFMSRVIEPMREANASIRAVASRVHQIDDYYEFTSIEDFRSCPPCMMKPILTHDKLYSLLRQGRINGWGYTADSLVDDKEMYDRLVERNGIVYTDEPDQFIDDEDREDRKRYCEENQYEEQDVLTLTSVVYSDDIELTPNEIEMISSAREMVDKVLNETHLDPTDIDNLRG